MGALSGGGGGTGIAKLAAVTSIKSAAKISCLKVIRYSLN